MRDGAKMDSIDGVQEKQNKQLRLWLSALLTDEGPRFQRWHSEQQTFVPRASTTDSDAFPFPGVPAGSPGGAHGSHGGPLIHFTHFNAAAHRHIRKSGLYAPSNLRAIAAREGTLPMFPTDAMVTLSGWWPLAADRATPMPLWDAESPLRPTGANGYLNWPRVALIAPNGNGTTSDAPGVQQFAGRTISDTRALPRDSFYRIRPSPAHLRVLMQDPRFRRAAIIALGRPMQAGDELALVAFHLLHFGLEEGLWLTFWWDAEQFGQHQAADLSGKPQESPLPAPWRNYRGDMTVSPLHPRETDGGPNVCFNPWFDAVFPDSGQGNGLKANCLSCHLRAGIPATGRVHVTRGRPDLEQEEGNIIYTRLLWSLANPRRTNP